MYLTMTFFVSVTVHSPPPLPSSRTADPSLESAPAVMESIADAVTHARFVGTETSSDEVVLVKILQVSGGQSR